MTETTQSGKRRSTGKRTGSKSDSPKREAVRSPRVTAGECPACPRHTDTAVYRTVGKTRYCKCNECGATWKKVGEYADPLRSYAAGLAETLDDAPRVDANGDVVIAIDEGVAREIAKQLRELAATS